jgi:P-type E1-E2 ATPase
MIELNIPGTGIIKLEHIVFDVNGTLAVDGYLREGVSRKMMAIQDRLQVHLLTADTHGRQCVIDQQLNLKAVRLEMGEEANQKAEYVIKLGGKKVIAVGQGANDAGMLKAAAIGISIFSQEGTAVEAFLESDIILPDIDAVFDLLENPLRIVATLRK